MCLIIFTEIIQQTDAPWTSFTESSYSVGEFSTSKAYFVHLAKTEPTEDHYHTFFMFHVPEEIEKTDGQHITHENIRDPIQNISTKGNNYRYCSSNIQNVGKLRAQPTANGINQIKSSVNSPLSSKF